MIEVTSNADGTSRLRVEGNPYEIAAETLGLVKAAFQALQGHTMAKESLRLALCNPKWEGYHPKETNEEGVEL